MTFQKLTAQPKARAPTKNLPPPWQPLVRGIFIGMSSRNSAHGNLGDAIQFDACVTSYTKGHGGNREDL